MFSPDRQQQTIIHHLRVRASPAGPASGLDPQVARQRAEFALNTADLRPPGLPPAVVLCVRRLRDPRPGGLDLSSAGQPASQAWQRAVQAALAQLARGAARPAREPVPAGAEAVLFADQGELLACLARDWLAGSLPLNWWWQSLLRGQAPERLVVQAWVESPAYFPAALEELALHGRALDFALRLDRATAQRILAAALDHFALPALRALVSGLGVAVSPAAAVLLNPPPAPWEPFAPESRAARLDVPQAALLGIGLALRRAPQAARSPGFAAGTRAWLQALSPPALPDRPGTFSAPPPAVPPALIPTADRRADGPLGEAARASSQSSPLPDLIPPRPSAAAPGQHPPPAGEPSFSAAPHTPAAIAPAAAASPNLPPSSPPLPPAETAAAAPAPSPAQTAAWPAPLDGAWFHTRHGGLFYLVNLGLYLGLYGDFSTPLAPGLDLPIWDFCALLWHALVPARPPLGDEEPDPIWSWLARLAGHPAGEPFGAGFAPPDEWLIPPAWLEPFSAAGQWRWSAAAGRLRIAHPAGFAVRDIPFSGHPAPRDLALDLPAASTLFPDPALAFPPVPAPTPALAQWLGWLVPYVRARLCLAFGLEDAGGDRLPELLNACPARVYLTETHLDVTFPLNRLPFEIRLAGLDRDPGWVPAASRYVMFYYED